MRCSSSWSGSCGGLTRPAGLICGGVCALGSGLFIRRTGMKSSLDRVGIRILRAPHPFGFQPTCERAFDLGKEISWHNLVFPNLDVFRPPPTAESQGDLQEAEIKTNDFHSAFFSSASTSLLTRREMRCFAT